MTSDIAENPAENHWADTAQAIKAHRQDMLHSITVQDTLKSQRDNANLICIGASVGFAACYVMLLLNQDKAYQFIENLGDAVRDAFTGKPKPPGPAPRR